MKMHSITLLLFAMDALLYKDVVYIHDDFVFTTVSYGVRIPSF
jgi:hypothetical protein